jgi:hypothetical protein
LAFSSLPLIRHHNIFKILEDLDASRIMQAAAQLSFVLVKFSTNRLPTLC